jgi:hypothetical protein
VYYINNKRKKHKRELKKFETKKPQEVFLARVAFLHPREGGRTFSRRKKEHNNPLWVIITRSILVVVERMWRTWGEYSVVYSLWIRESRMTTEIVWKILSQT